MYFKLADRKSWYGIYFTLFKWLKNIVGVVLNLKTCTIQPLFKTLNLQEFKLKLFIQKIAYVKIK